MTTYHQNMGKQAPYGMTGTVHTRIPGGGIPMSEDAEREAYIKGALTVAECLKPWNHYLCPRGVPCWGSVGAENCRRCWTDAIRSGEWPKGKA